MVLQGAWIEWTHVLLMDFCKADLTALPIVPCVNFAMMLCDKCIGSNGRIFAVYLLYHLSRVHLFTV